MKFLNKGFTLIELIVVIAVFLLIIGVAITIFVSIINNQRMILSQQQLLNQISYAEEYMSKAMRMAKKDEAGSCLIDDNNESHPGYIYLLTRPDISNQSYTGIKFINASDNDTCQEFFLDSSGETPVLKEIKNGIPSSGISITSEALKINSVRFGINGTTGCYGVEDVCPIGASDTETAQPKVTILLNIQIPGDAMNPVRIIQTTVSQRNLNAQ
jgi:prepilin-type N-terminal cleavage/methylation domain-containing protein